MKAAVVRRFALLLVGVFASTGTTYLLFLVFSRNTSIRDLGLYGLATAFVAIIVRFMDGLSGQRLFQEIGRFRSLENLSVVNFHRFLAYFLVGSVVELLGRILIGSDFHWIGILILGQGLYASVVGTRILESRNRPLLTAQICNSFVFTLAVIFIITIDHVLSSDEMIFINAVVLIVSALPFVSIDVLEWRKRRKLDRFEVWNVLYGSAAGRKQLAILSGYQCANALSGSVDTLVAGFGGASDVARFQAAQRPMLALATVNVAIGQFAMNRFANEPHHIGKRLLLVFSPTIIVWPLIGFFCLLSLPLIMPTETIPSVWIGVLLGFAYGLGALMQITGIYLMLHHQTMDLLKSTSLQLGIMLVTGYCLVPYFGPIGVAISLVIARIAGFLFQWNRMHRTSLLISGRGSGRRRASKNT